MASLETPAALGTAIRERRRALKLTQDDLALAIGVNRRVIGQLERGKDTVWLGIAFRAARALGLDLSVRARDEIDA